MATPVVRNEPGKELDEVTEDGALLDLPTSGAEEQSKFENLETEIILASPNNKQFLLENEEKAPATRSCYENPLVLIFFSHGLSCWGDRMWAFTVGMLLIDWENLQSLRTVAIHQLCQSIAVFIFGALIGSWVDRTRRLRATVSSIIVQNIFVCSSAIVLLALLLTSRGRNKHEPALWHHHFAIALSIAFSTLAHLASVACQLTVVKDWVPTLCNDDRTKLTKTNATLKRIDLMTATLSPVLAGAAMELTGPWTGGLVVVCWNIISAPCEIALLYAVYRRNVLLQVPKQPAANSENQQSNCANVPLMRPAFTLIRGWGTYWHQIVRWSGASLSALYFTVLSFDAVTTAYVRSLCVSELVVAAVRIGSSVLGLVGTIVFPQVRKKFGLRLGGAIFYVCHAAILTFAVVSVFLPGSPFDPINSNADSRSQQQFVLFNNSTNFSPLENKNNGTVNNNVTSECIDGDNIGGYRLPHLWVLTISVILSRLTLWGTDLSINQALVERVAAKERGVVNGVQSSLNQLVDLIRLTAVICIPYPSQFGYLVIATFSWIAAGSLLYIIGSPPDDTQNIAS